VKIVQVIHAFPPYSRAGSENYLEALAIELKRRHELTVFHRIADPELSEYEITEGYSGGIPVVKLNRCFSDLDDFSGTYRSEAASAAFAAFLDREAPDVVHFHHLTCLSTTSVSEAKQRGIPVVCTLHDFWILCPRSQLVRRDQSLCERHTSTDCVNCMAGQLRIRGGYARARSLWKRSQKLTRLRLPMPRRLLGKLAARPFSNESDALEQIRAREAHMLEICSEVDRFISPSRFLRDLFVDFGLPESKIVVSDNGFDLSHWSNPPQRVRKAGDRLRVAYIGTWIPTKGVHILVEAFRALDPKQAVLDIHGYAVPYEGVDDYDEELRSLAGGATHIRFGKAYRPEELPMLLAEADVLVIPSTWYENSPLTVHEAFLAGLPVVAAGHGGMAEFVVHEQNGLHFEPGNAVSLRAALQRLIDDEALLARLAPSASRVKSIEENARELENCYRELGAG
jgi:glycosyltransferase involved in cell wall biosynthesis